MKGWPGWVDLGGW